MGKLGTLQIVHESMKAVLFITAVVGLTVLSLLMKHHLWYRRLQTGSVPFVVHPVYFSLPHGNVETVSIMHSQESQPSSVAKRKMSGTVQGLQGPLGHCL